MKVSKREVMGTASAYIDLRFINPTTAMVEQLFSLSGNVFKEHLGNDNFLENESSKVVARAVHDCGFDDEE